MGVVEELKVKVTAETAAAQRELDRLKKSTTGNTQAFSSMAKTLIGFGGVTAALVATKRLVIDNIKAGVQYAAAIEQQTIAFEVLLGSASEARDLLADIQKFAAATPFQLPDLQKGTQRLIAFGTAADDAVDTLRMLGDLSMGNVAILDRLTLAYGKLQAKGKATLEELNMFTEAGVPLMSALADTLEVTTEELFKMVSQGEVSFDDVSEALAGLTSQGGQFFEMTEKQSKTLNGLWSTMKDNIDALRGSFAEHGGLNDALKDAITLATTLVQKIAQTRIIGATGRDFAELGKDVSRIRGGDVRGSDISTIQALIDVLSPEGFGELNFFQKGNLARGVLPGQLNTPKNRAALVDMLNLALGDAERAFISEGRLAGFAQGDTKTGGGIGASQARGVLSTDMQVAMFLEAMQSGVFGPASGSGLPGLSSLSVGAHMSRLRNRQALGILDAEMLNPLSQAYAIPGVTSPFTRGPGGQAGAAGAFTGLGTQAQFAPGVAALLAGGQSNLFGTGQQNVFGAGVGGNAFSSVVSNMQELETANEALLETETALVSVFAEEVEVLKEMSPVIKQLGEDLLQAFSGQMIDALFEFGRAMGEGADATESVAAGVLSFAESLAQNLPNILLSAAATAASMGNFPLAAGLLAAAGGAAVIGGAFIGGVDQVRSGDGRASGAVVVNNTRVEGNVFVDDELDRRAVSAVGRAGRGY